MKFNVRIKTIIKEHRIPFDNFENNENLWIQCDTHANIKNHWISCENQENQENFEI